MPADAPRVVERRAGLRRAGCRRTSRRRAAAAARTAASGSRDDSSRVMRVRRVPSANASTRVRADDRRVQEAHERAGVRLHRPAHVEQQHDAAALPRRRVDERARVIGSPPAAQRAAHGAAHVGRRRGDASSGGGAATAASRPARRRSAISLRASANSAGVYAAKSRGAAPRPGSTAPRARARRSSSASPLVVAVRRRGTSSARITCSTETGRSSASGAIAEPERVERAVVGRRCPRAA